MARGWLKIVELGAGLFTRRSGLLYVWDGMQQLGSHPASSAGKTQMDTD